MLSTQNRTPLAPPQRPNGSVLLLLVYVPFTVVGLCVIYAVCAFRDAMSSMLALCHFPQGKSFSLAGLARLSLFFLPPEVERSCPSPCQPSPSPAERPHLSSCFRARTLALRSAQLCQQISWCVSHSGEMQIIKKEVKL